MRVSLINLNLIAKDAIGRSLMDKARYFRDRGDEVRVYVQSIADDVPGDVRALCVTCNLAQLVGGDNWPAGQREHFFASDLYIYDYPNWYELVESIREVDRGVVVFDYHGVTPPELWGSEEALGMLRRSLDELPDLLSHADYAIGHSAFTHGELVERYGFRADRAFMFPYAVPLEDFFPGERDPEMVRRYGLAGQRVLLYVGRMAGNKRVDLLVRALPLIRQEYPETMLLLVGDDRSSAYAPLVADVKRLARELGVEKRVVFTGPVPYLPPYYRLADVYVTSSLHEGFCVPLIEAMASGLPVVGTNSTAIPHTLGDAGLTFAPEDVEGLAEQVLSLFRDPALAETLRQRGLERAAAYSLEAFHQHWDAVLEQAMRYQAGLSEARTPAEPAAPAASEPPTMAPAAAPAIPAPAPDRENHYRELEAAGDIALRSYTVRSDKPVIGPIIAWIRRNLTSHLKEPYVDPIIERQVQVNRRVIWELRALDGQVRTAAAASEGWREHLGQLRQQFESWMAPHQAQQEQLQARIQALSEALETDLAQTLSSAAAEMAHLNQASAAIEAFEARAAGWQREVETRTAALQQEHETRAAAWEQADKARASRDAALWAQWEQLRAAHDALTQRQEVLAQQLADLRQLLDENPEAVRRDVKAVREALGGLSDEMSQRIEQLSTLLAPSGQIEGGFNYFLHADAVGGRPDIVRQVYAPLVERFRHAPGVVDLGCGPGIFLELLREAGIPSYGVDLDEDSVLLCRKKGLDVRQEDLLAHLAAVPDKSLGGIYAAHVVEHLPAPRLWEFAQLCHRKLLYGGPLVLVTPNAASLSIFYHTFYKDLTHNKPIHPQALQFLLEANGFRKVELSSLSPMPEELKLDLLDVELAADEAQRQWALTLNRDLQRVNGLLFGDQDCVACAVK